ncbi:MAG: hypothetical protein AB7G93_10520 [Bdellovibrionales bacterium]
MKLLFRLYFVLLALLVAMDATADCRLARDVPATQAHRVLTRFLEAKKQFELLTLKSAGWAESYCKVDISPLREDGGFDIVAKEISRKDDSEVRRLVVSVPADVSSHVSCEVFTQQRPIDDQDLIALFVQYNFKTQKVSEPSRVVTDGKHFWVDFAKQMVSVGDTSLPNGVLDCRLR